MRITSFSIENVLGARRATLQLPASGVALVAGGNADGKSSVAEALRLALLSWSDRAGPKKAWPELVTDGARIGRVTVMTDTGPIKLTLPSGDVDGITDLHPAADLCLGKTRITSVKKSERAALIKGLVGTSNDTDEVARRLLARGHQPGYVERIRTLLRSGVEAAREEAAGMAREAKGEWRHITGQNWGCKAGETWQPEGEPEHPADAAFDAIEQACVETLKAEESRLKAAERDLARAQPMHPDDLQALRDRAATFATSEASRVKVESDTKAAERRVVELREELAGIAYDAQSCPHCGGLLHIQNDAPVAIKGTPAPGRDREIVRLALDAAEDDLSTAQDALREAQAAVAKADAAARRLAAESAAAPPNIDDLEAAVASAKAKHDAASEAVQRLRDSQAWHRTNRRARDAHEIVLAWTALADDLGPQGVAAGLAGSAIATLNAEAALICDALSFGAVTIGADGGAFYDDRESWYCSESERWRIDTVVAVALARISGLGIVILDRLDILAPALRPGVLSGLMRLQLGAAVICCTVAQKPTVPPSIGLLWMGGEQAQAVAA